METNEDTGITEIGRSLIIKYYDGTPPAFRCVVCGEEHGKAAEGWGTFRLPDMGLVCILCTSRNAPVLASGLGAIWAVIRSNSPSKDYGREPNIDWVTPQDLESVAAWIVGELNSKEQRTRDELRKMSHLLMLAVRSRLRGKPSKGFTSPDEFFAAFTDTPAPFEELDTDPDENTPE